MKLSRSLIASASVLVGTLSLGNVAHAATFIPGAQCRSVQELDVKANNGFAEVQDNYLVNGFKPGTNQYDKNYNLTIQCWAAVSNYGNELQVEIRYKDYSRLGTLMCFAESYNANMTLIDRTHVSASEVKGQVSQKMTLVDQNLANAENDGRDPAFVKVQCDIPSRHTTTGPVTDAPSGIKSIKIW